MEHVWELLARARDAWRSGADEECDGIVRQLEDTPRDGEALGETHLLRAVLSARDLTRMLDGLRGAAARLPNGSRLLAARDSLLRGGGYGLCALHYAPGGLDRALDALAEIEDVYFRLTKADRGLAALAAAEAAYFRYDLDRAEVLGNKALFLSRGGGAIQVASGAAVILAHIALHRGDADQWTSAIRTLTRLEANAPSSDECAKWNACMRMAELNGSIGLQARVSEALREDAFFADALPAPARSMAIYVHTFYQCMAGSWARALGMLQGALPEADATGGVLSRIILRMVGACCYYKASAPDYAREWIDEAAALAQPDGIFLPFVEFDPLTGGECLRALRRAGADTAQLPAQRHLFRVGWARLNRNLLKQTALPGTLTLAETRVAELCAQGLTNPQIASRLYLSTETVKTHLRSVFCKCEVGRRNELIRLYAKKDEPSRLL